MTWTNKEEVEGSFNLTKPGNINMHNFLYNNISEFGGNLEGMLDEGNYRSTVQNMHKFCWKAQYFKSADVSMLGHGCDVSQYPQFYDTNKNIYQMLPRPYVGSYSGEKDRQIFSNHILLHYPNRLKHLLKFQLLKCQL